MADTARPVPFRVELDVRAFVSELWESFGMKEQNASAQFDRDWHRMHVFVNGRRMRTVSQFERALGLHPCYQGVRLLCTQASLADACVAVRDRLAATGPQGPADGAAQLSQLGDDWVRVFVTATPGRPSARVEMEKALTLIDTDDGERVPGSTVLTVTCFELLGTDLHGASVHVDPLVA